MSSCKPRLKNEKIIDNVLKILLQYVIVLIVSYNMVCAGYFKNKETDYPKNNVKNTKTGGKGVRG